MQVLHMIGQSYAMFFDGKMWLEIFTNPANWGLVFTLILMEGLLSTDNAIVLATQVLPLPKNQQKKALLYGLWGAYLFRFIAIGLGNGLTKIMWIKALGGLYLLWMSIKFAKDKFFSKNAEEGEGEEGEEAQPSHKFDGLAKYIGVFWATVITVELLDITFSVDSIMAAFGVSDVSGILLLGGMLGILMMRGVAQLFIKLLEKVPELENTAYVLIAFIGVKMLLTLAHIELGSTIFFIFVVISFAVTFAVHFAKNGKSHNA